MVEPTVQVNIIYDRQDEWCSAECGIDWFSAETTALTGQQIRERFGDRVELSFVDLTKSGAGALKWKQRVREENLLLPLLVVDGRVRVSGQFDPHLLLDAIEAEIEMKKGQE